MTKFKQQRNWTVSKDTVETSALKYISPLNNTGLSWLLHLHTIFSVVNTAMLYNPYLVEFTDAEEL